MTRDLQLRDVIDDDLPIFFENQQDEEANLMAAFTAKDPTDREAFDAHWNRIRADETVTIRTITLDGEVAGSVLSYVQSGQPEVSYWISRACWGRGVATEALEQFLKIQEARPIFARVAKDNRASIRVLEKCGFAVVGEDRGFANARGEEIDELVMSLAAAAPEKEPAMSLTDFGWNDDWAGRLAALELPDGRPARVIAQHRELYRVHTGLEELPARVAGRLRHLAQSGADLPAVGDWVGLGSGNTDGEASILAVLPRVTSFSRKVAGTRTDEQVVAANVDTVWIMSAFGPDLNAARIERYLALVWQGGAMPVVVLTKSDLEDNPDLVVTELQDRVIGVPICAVSSVDGAGLDELRRYLTPGATIALLGSSGVGKSTLLNRLMGHEVMKVAEIREGLGKGRHTTTHRQLFRLPSGSLLLDTPGMRELQLWSAEEGIEKGFTDIEELAAGCRYADCGHESEPGCAVIAAVESGELAPERLASFAKLKRESAYLDRKLDVRAAQEHERKWKAIKKDYDRHFKKKR